MGVPLEDEEGLTRRQVPHPHTLIITAAGQPAISQLDHTPDLLETPLPSEGEELKPLTSVWPERVSAARPVSASQTLTVVSADPLKILNPSLDTARAYTA